MMKNKDNKNNINENKLRVSIFRRLGYSLLYFVCQIILIAIIVNVILAIFTILNRLGIIDNSISSCTLNIALLQTILLICSFTSIFIVQFPLNTILKFISAYERIRNGDYSVRLSFRKPKVLAKTAERFNNMVAQLQKTEMLSSDFIDKFSHEMKTPVASINGFAKLLKNDDIPKEIRNEYLDIIIHESESLSHLSKRILILSKLEEQTEISDKTTVNISEQIRKTIALTYHKWSEKNLKINCENQDYFISGNEDMLEQVWINMIDNAIKFSPDGGEINIRITLSHGYLYITLSNNGAPIPKENHSDIFKKFFQCNKYDAISGNGLGLPMVKQIIRLHNGDVYVKKSDFTATIFEVNLPATD